MKWFMCMAFILSPLSVTSADDTFQPLFDGKTTNGWTFTLRPTKDAPDVKPDPAKTWSIQDGVLKCNGKPNGYIATEKEYSDYVLRFQWRYPKDSKGGNSGLLVHIVGEDKVWPNCIEAQLASGSAGDFWLIANEKGTLPKLDIDEKQKDAKNKQGRHYFRMTKEANVEKPFGEWNQYEVTCSGGDITLVINGKTVNVGKNGELTKGRIGLQSEGVPIEFRNIEIRSLKK